MVQYIMDRMGNKFILAVAVHVLFTLGGSNSAIITGDSGYLINQSTYTENGKCLQEIAVTGNGVSDSFQIPCSEGGLNSISTGGVLIYGDPSQNKFSLYSDQPNTLVVFENGKCTKKTYTSTDSGSTSSSAPMSDDECTTIKNKISEKIKKEAKYWAAWTKNFDENMAKTFSSGFPFNNGDDDNNDGDSSTESSKKSETKERSWWDRLWD